MDLNSTAVADLGEHAVSSMFVPLMGEHQIYQSSDAPGALKLMAAILAAAISERDEEWLNSCIESRLAFSFRSIAAALRRSDPQFIEEVREAMRHRTPQQLARRTGRRGM